MSNLNKYVSVMKFTEPFTFGGEVIRKGQYVGRSGPVDAIENALLADLKIGDISKLLQFFIEECNLQWMHKVAPRILEIEYVEL